jgi:hypothetical protein
MRPYKPGYWWYKTYDDREKIAYIASGFSFELCVIDNNRTVCIYVFECSSEFGEWLGPAYPPKKVKSFECRHGRTTYCNTKKAVLLDDVKEYLLEEQ